MIPQWTIMLVDAVGAAALLACVLLILARGQWFRRPTRLLLGLIACLAFLVSIGNFLEWSNILPEADIAEDFIYPVVPILWLFLFAMALERADADRLRQSYDRMAGVQELALKLTVSLEPRAVMGEVVAVAGRLLEAPFVVILTPDAQGDRLVAQAYKGPSPEEAEALSAPVQEGLGGRAFVGRRPCRADRPAQDLGTAVAHVLEHHGITNLVTIPLLFQGEAVGTLSVGRTQGHTFGDEEVRLLETFSAHAAVAIENARLYKQVAESEAKYRVLVENAQAAIVVVDAYRSIVFWNRGAERLFGWTADEALHKHIDLIYPEESRRQIVQRVLPALQRERVWSGEFPALRKDGTVFTTFLNLSRVTDSQGNVISTLGILSDVTERVRLRDQLFQAQKMQTIGELASGISHDFNNLLTAVLGFSSLLQASLPKEGDAAEAARSIEQAAERGVQLVRQLMAFSQKHPTRQEPVDLNAIVKEAVELLARTFPKAALLRSDLEPGLYPIQGDPTQMHQVVMNLAVNARDAMEAGGTLALSTENLVLDAEDPLANVLAAGPCVALTVSDTGRGIAPEDKPHIFEPFFTTKGKAGGTGLGLSTVYAIVARH
ncbi:MAG: PAS domain S-box protein, partial [Acidobacteria bacterium]|nr:PAS domain S-box protein [Acidobacteriota bacterium]